MERRMSFGSLNKFNGILNLLSGNFLPLSDERAGLNFGVMLFILTTWVIKISYVATMLIGLYLYAPVMTAIQESGVVLILISETFILSVYFILRRDDLYSLIRKFNEIVVDTDDFKKCVRDAFEPRQRYLKIYTIGTLISPFVWAGSPVLKILENDVFNASDFTVTAYLPGAPFDTKTFVAGVTLQILGVFYVSFSKISIDSYMSYFVMFLTAEYTYVRAKLAEAMHRKNNEENNELTVADDLRKCVQHHCAVIETGRMVIDIVAIHVTVTYIHSICKYCFLGFSFITFTDSFVDKWTHFSYGIACIIQSYILCASHQELLEASVSVTDDAFYEDWHGRDKTIKSMFATIELSNRIECRITAYRSLDLTIPTLAVILRKAYSACLLLLEIK